jgi:hypothetical protein
MAIIYLTIFLSRNIYTQIIYIYHLEDSVARYFMANKPDKPTSKEIKRWSNLEPVAPVQKVLTEYLQMSMSSHESTIQEVLFGFSFSNKPYVTYSVEGANIENAYDLHIGIKQITLGSFVLCIANRGPYPLEFRINYQITGNV